LQLDRLVANLKGHPARARLGNRYKLPVDLTLIETPCRFINNESGRFYFHQYVSQLVPSHLKLFQPLFELLTLFNIGKGPIESPSESSCQQQLPDIS
jgi:hypothetical protein